MIYLLMVIFLVGGNSPPVFTACQETIKQVIWPMEKGTTQWPILTRKKDDIFYIIQMRSSRTRRGVETNIYEVKR